MLKIVQHLCFLPSPLLKDENKDTEARFTFLHECRNDTHLHIVSLLLQSLCWKGFLPVSVAQNSSGRISFLLTCPPEFSCFLSSTLSLYFCYSSEVSSFHIVAFDLASSGIDRWILVQKHRSLGRCSISLIQAGLFGLVRMINESVEGEADGQRWGNRYPVSPAISAVMARLEYRCVRGTCSQAGRWARSTHANADIAPSAQLRCSIKSARLSAASVWLQWVKSCLAAVSTNLPSGIQIQEDLFWLGLLSRGWVCLQRLQSALRDCIWL